MPPPHHSPPGTPGLSLYARARHGLLVALCVAIYYSSSAAANNWNKWLVELHAPPGGGPSTPAVTPTVLTLLHLLIALSSDIVIMRRTGDMVIAAKLAADSRRTLWDVVHTFAPIAVCVTLSKLTTYLSYQYVSIALAHTAKASEPIFNVIVAALLFGEWHRRNVYLSLIPITLGIALASMSDFSYNHTGFLIAVSSALMKVLQNIATKRVMDTGRFTFWEIHAYCGAASLLVLTPLLLWESWHSGGRTMWAWALALARLPLLALAFDSLLQWASSVSAYWVLSLVSHLSATIINVLKRLLMILAGIWTAAAAGRMSMWNLAGVMLAISGVLWYNLVVAQQDQDAKAALESSSGGSGGGGGALGATATALPASGAGGSGSGAGEDAELEASHLLGMSGIGGLAMGGGGASGGGLRGLAAAAGGTAGLPSIDEEEGGLRSSGIGGEGAAAEEAKPRGSSSSIVSSATGAVSRRGSSFEGPGGGGGGGGGSGGSSGSSSLGLGSSASASSSHFFSAAVHSARTLGVPRSLLVSMGLIPPQVLRGNERRSSSGDWTGSAGARPAVGLLGGGGGGAGSGAGSSSSADISASGEAQALSIGGSSGGVVGGGGEARLGAAAAASGGSSSSSSNSGSGSSSISSSGSGGGAGSGSSSGSSGVGLLPHPAGMASSGASLFSPLGVPSAAPVAPGAGSGVSPALGSLVRRPLGVPVIKL